MGHEAFVFLLVAPILFGVTLPSLAKQARRELIDKNVGEKNRLVLAKDAEIDEAIENLNLALA